MTNETPDPWEPIGIAIWHVLDYKPSTSFWGSPPEFTHLLRSSLMDSRRGLFWGSLWGSLWDSLTESTHDE